MKNGKKIWNVALIYENYDIYVKNTILQLISRLF